MRLSITTADRIPGHYADVTSDSARPHPVAVAVALGTVLRHTAFRVRRTIARSLCIRAAASHRITSVNRTRVAVIAVLVNETCHTLPRVLVAVIER